MTRDRVMPCKACVRQVRARPEWEGAGPGRKVKAVCVHCGARCGYLPREDGRDLPEPKARPETPSLPGMDD